MKNGIQNSEKPPPTPPPLRSNGFDCKIHLKSNELNCDGDDDGDQNYESDKMFSRISIECEFDKFSLVGQIMHLYVLPTNQSINQSIILMIFYQPIAGYGDCIGDFMEEIF